MIVLISYLKKEKKMSDKLSEKKRNIQQIPFRLHVNDHKVLKSKVSLDGINIQCLVESCILAYLEGDKHIRDIAKEHKTLNTVNKKNVSWSTREQEKILSEIENLEEDGG